MQRLTRSCFCISRGCNNARANFERLLQYAKKHGPTLVTTVCVGLLLMVQGNPSLFVIGFAVAGGGICSTCLRMDETAGWTKFELTAPVSRTTVVVEKYVLLLLLTAIGLIVGGAISYVAGTVTDTLDISQFIMYVSVAFSIFPH